MSVPILAFIYIVAGIFLIFYGIKGITQRNLNKHNLLVVFFITLIIALSVVFASIIASKQLP